MNPGLKKPDEVDCGRACERGERASERRAHHVTPKPDRVRTHPADRQRERDPDSVRESNLQDACEARARSTKEIPATKRVKRARTPESADLQDVAQHEPRCRPCPHECVDECARLMQYKRCFVWVFTRDGHTASAISSTTQFICRARTRSQLKKMEGRGASSDTGTCLSVCILKAARGVARWELARTE